MEIIFSDKSNNYNIEFEKNVILFGANNSGKTKILTTIYDSIKSGKAIVNSLKISKNDYDVIFFSEDSDFNDEFSFTKNNFFRATIYNSIAESIDKNKLLNEVNTTFDKIDEVVNNYLDNNINNIFNNSLKFDINIDDLDNIINKFTTVYINDLSETKKIPKSFKRLLLYQLSVINSDNNKDKFIIIDDFDLYMDTSNIIQILNFISKYSSNSIHFILSTANPLVYNYLNSNCTIYKIKNEQIYRFPKLDSLITKSILRNEFEKCHDLISFEKFYNDNIALTSKKDIDNFYNYYYTYLKTNIGIILTSNFVSFNNLNTASSFIFTRDNMELFFLKFVCEELLTDYEITDIL